MKCLNVKVETFASAEDFLRSDRLTSTACLILDVHMPGLSGLELQRELIVSGHNMPIIFLAAFANERAAAEALQAGADSFLFKPFDNDVLVNHINQVLKQHGLPDPRP
jgi:FixJ family two-component response regulator